MTKGLTWREFAVCAQIDPELFFPEKGTNTRAGAALAKKICSTCPVTEQCLKEALRIEQIFASRFGIWGGTTPHERSAMDPKRSWLNAV